RRDHDVQRHEQVRRRPADLDRDAERQREHDEQRQHERPPGDQPRERRDRRERHDAGEPRRQRMVAHDRELRRVPDVGQQQHRRERERAADRERPLTRLAREQRSRREQHRDDGAGLRQRAREREEGGRGHRRAECSPWRARAGGRGPCAEAGPATRSSSLWRDARSPPPPGACPRAARGRLRQRRHDRRRRQPRADGRLDPGGRARGGVRSARRAARLSAREGHRRAEGRAADEQTRDPPGRRRRVRHVRRHAGRGGGHPAAQRGPRRRGDRAAPADRRPPRRRRAQSDRVLPPGAGHEILSESTVSPRLTGKRLLLLVVWLIPIAGVVWWAAKQRAPTFPSSFGGIMALVGALALYAVATLMRSERWARILWRAGVRDATRGDAYALVPIGYMGNNVLPARGGELLRTFLLGGRARATKRTILGTILAERVLDAVALGVILVVLATGLLHKLPKPHEAVLLAGGALLVVLVLAAVVAFVRYRERLVFVLRALAPMAAPLRQ